MPKKIEKLLPKVKDSQSGDSEYDMTKNLAKRRQSQGAPEAKRRRLLKDTNTSAIQDYHQEQARLIRSTIRDGQQRRETQRRQQLAAVESTPAAQDYHRGLASFMEKAIEESRKGQEMRQQRQRKEAANIPTENIPALRSYHRDLAEHAANMAKEE